MPTRLYIHESIRISVKHRKDYLDHITKVWAPHSRELYGMTCFGVWATNGSTAAWPEAIVLWELAERASFSRMLSGEYAHLHTADAPIADHYQIFWASAPAGVRDRSGFDRLLEPTPASPSLANAIAAGIRGAGYYHETIRSRPGAIHEVLRLLEDDWKPLAEERGLRFVAAFRTLMRHDSEAIALWALPEWSAWERIDAIAGDSRARAFREKLAGLDVDWRGKLLAPAAENPLNLGRAL